MLATRLTQKLQQNTALKKGDMLLVAVSGGADSVMLLHALAHTQAQHGFRLHIATLNHGLRAAAAADTDFVRALADTLMLPCTVGKLNTPEIAAQYHEGIEAAARRGRYLFLAETARHINAAAVLTAHHADDQAETVLMHILRGAGLTGLQGMLDIAPLPYTPELCLIRPLLGVTRAEIEAYCAEHGLEPRQDETNADTTLLRNQLRHDILPMLAQVNPQIKAALARLADVAQVEQAFMQHIFEREVLPYLYSEGQQVRVEIARFRGWHAALQQRCIVWAWQQLVTTPTLRHERIRAVIEHVPHGQQGDIIELGDKVQVRIAYEWLIAECSQSAAPLPDRAVQMVHVPGLTALDGKNWLYITLEPHENFQATLAVHDNATLLLRTRQNGDTFKPLGMGGKTRKLKDWFIDRKVAADERDRIPLLVINGEIAAIILPERWTISHVFAGQNITKRLMYCSIVANDVEKP